MTFVIQKAMDLISRQRFSLHSEKQLQAQIHDVLIRGGLPFKREFPLDGLGNIDFMLPAFGIGMEVKIKGQAKAIYKQCARYCEHTSIKALVLITNETMGFPEEIHGKPCYVIKLGRSWL